MRVTSNVLTRESYDSLVWCYMLQLGAYAEAEGGRYLGSMIDGRTPPGAPGRYFGLSRSDPLLRAVSEWGMIWRGMADDRGLDDLLRDTGSAVDRVDLILVYECDVRPAVRVRVYGRPRAAGLRGGGSGAYEYDRTS